MKIQINSQFHRMDYSGLSSLTKLTTKMYVLHLVEMVLVLPILPHSVSKLYLRGTESRAALAGHKINFFFQVATRLLNILKLVAMTHTQTHFYPVTVLDRLTWKLLKIRTSYKEDTGLGHIKHERLPKSKMASSDDRFTFEIVHVLRFENKLNKELCCRFIFTNLQQSLDL